MRRRLRADQCAVLEHGDAVAEREDLVQAVRDEDDRDALRAERPQPLEQQLDLAAGDDRRRLVEHEQPDVVDQRARDLDHLLVGDRQSPTRRADRARRRALSEGRSPRARAPMVDGAARTAPLMADEDVLRDRQFGKENELLIDDVDAAALGVARRRPADGGAVEVDLAASGGKRRR